MLKYEINGETGVEAESLRLAPGPAPGGAEDKGDDACGGAPPPFFANISPLDVFSIGKIKSHFSSR